MNRLHECSRLIASKQTRVRVDKQGGKVDCYTALDKTRRPGRRCFIQQVFQGLITDVKTREHFREQQTALSAPCCSTSGSTLPLATWASTRRVTKILLLDLDGARKTPLLHMPKIDRVGRSATQSWSLPAWEFYKFETKKKVVASDTPTAQPSLDDDKQHEPTNSNTPTETTDRKENANLPRHNNTPRMQANTSATTEP